MSANETAPAKHTNGFYAQAVASFAVSIGAMVIGIAFLETTWWIRGFLIVGTMYLVTSTITMSKVIRDREESSAIHHRIDAVRLERLLAEYDPLQPAGLVPSGPAHH